MYHDNIYYNYYYYSILYFLEKFTETQIVANAFLMFAAGFETVSLTIAFCLHELALKKYIQDRAREEIKLKNRKYNGIINKDFLMELNYLDMIIAGNLLHILV